MRLASGSVQSIYGTRWLVRYGLLEANINAAQDTTSNTVQSVHEDTHVKMPGGKKCVVWMKRREIGG